MKPATILVVDDDSSITASVALLLKHAGHRSVTAANPAEALQRLAQFSDCALVLQDMNFTRATTGAEGLELLRQIRSQRPGLPVILMTAWGSIGLAVEGMKAGASDFVTKPWNNAQLLSVVETALGLAASPSGAGAELPTREALDEAFDFGPLVGEDARLRRVLQIIGRVAPTDASVLITGESGTGKELVAEALHRNSRRRAGPFVKVNLGGISATLFDSEMFGHVKGAFTDARSDRQGRFALAHGGTIFLDEIGELDGAGQVKLLRVLQDRTYEVLGSSNTRQVDVRVVAATNRNLPDMVGRGLFREDLLYRLNLIAIHLPPLRERGGDVARLARQFLGTLASVYRRDRLELAPAALRFLEGQGWPGNIRQLKQWVERAVLISPEAEVLEVGHLQVTAAMESGNGAEIDRAVGAVPPSEMPAGDNLPVVGSMTIDEIEKAMIEKALRHHQGNLSRVADSLGLSRAALYRRLERYGIPT
jgi:two-component system NtrC family response regulator